MSEHKITDQTYELLTAWMRDYVTKEFGKELMYLFALAKEHNEDRYNAAIDKGLR